MPEIEGRLIRRNSALELASSSEPVLLYVTEMMHVLTGLKPSDRCTLASRVSFDWWPSDRGRAVLILTSPTSENFGIHVVFGSCQNGAKKEAKIMTQAMQLLVQSGQRAPDFAVPAVQDDRTIALADYRDRSPLLLGLFPGLYCPFCRRALAQMAATAERLKPLGVESLAIVATELENARLYFRFRPTRLALGADPQRTTHRSFGVPRVELTPEVMQIAEKTCINPSGELPEPLPIPAAFDALNNLDRFQPTAIDQREAEATFGQLKGQFLIDCEGIVRWANVECGKEGLSGVGKFPTHDELLAAARFVLDH